MSYYLTDGAHVLISGATGAGDEYGGKSVLANWWFQQSVVRGWHDLGVYFNPKGLAYVDRKDRVKRVRSLGELASAYRDGYRLIDYYPRGDQADEHANVVATLRNLPGSKILVHDEAQGYKVSDSLSWSLAQGGNMEQSAETTGDMRSLVVTQRPWNLPEEQRANMPLKVWVGPFGNEAEHFFSAERMQAAGQKVAEATGAYRWSVTDAGEYVETNEPVPEEYA